MRIFLVRHGETEHNVARRIQGPLLDDPLNEHGLEQAARLEAHFAKQHAEGLRLGAVYTSPMKRAQMTAEALARGAQVARVERLDGVIEFSWGIYLGKTESDETLAAMKRAHAEWTSGNADYAPPEGESPSSAWRRVTAALEPIVARHAGRDEAIAVVAHGRINKVLLAGLVHGDLRRMDEFPQGNTSVTLLERITSPDARALGASGALVGEGVSWKVHYVNKKDHLEGLERSRLNEGPDSPLV